MSSCPELPREVLLKILSFCDEKTIVEAMCANSMCYNLVQNNRRRMPKYKLHAIRFRHLYKEENIVVELCRKKTLVDGSTILEMKSLEMFCDEDLSAGLACYVVNAVLCFCRARFWSRIGPECIRFTAHFKTTADIQRCLTVLLQRIEFEEIDMSKLSARQMESVASALCASASRCRLLRLDLAESDDPAVRERLLDLSTACIKLTGARDLDFSVDNNMSAEELSERFYQPINDIKFHFMRLQKQKPPVPIATIHPLPNAMCFSTIFNFDRHLDELIQLVLTWRQRDMTVGCNHIITPGEGDMLALFQEFQDRLRTKYADLFIFQTIATGRIVAVIRKDCPSKFLLVKITHYPGHFVWRIKRRDKNCIRSDEDKCMIFC